MFEQFSKQARAAIVAAQEAARDAGAPFIDATHVAIGCLAHPKSDACRILQRSGLDPGKVGAQWRRHFSDDKILGHIPFTKLAKKALEQSLRSSLRTGGGVISTAHVLAGVVDADPGGKASSDLVLLGLGRAKLEEEYVVLEKREKPPLASSVPSTPSEGADYIHRLETGDDPTPIDLLLVAELRGDMKAMQSVAQQAWDQTGDEASVLFNGMVAAIGQMGDWEAYQNHLAEALERRQSRGLLLDAAQIATLYGRLPLARQYLAQLAEMPDRTGGLLDPLLAAHEIELVLAEGRTPSIAFGKILRRPLPEKGKHIWIHMQAHVAYIKLLIAHGKLRRAARLADKLVKNATIATFTGLEAQGLALRAECHQRLQQSQQASADYQRAIELGERLGLNMFVDRWRTHSRDQT